MKKLGFTLAEVLITLTVIGVVFVLATPAIISNVGQAKIGPTLAKFNNTFSNTMELMMQRNAIEELETNRGMLNAQIELIGVNMVMVPYNLNQYTFTDALGSNSQTIFTDSTLQQQFDRLKDDILQGTSGNLGIQDLDNLARQLLTNFLGHKLSDGSEFFVVPLGTKVAISLGIYRGIVAEIIYDINGEQGPNRVGTDVFGFLLDASGVLVPAGSMAHKYIDQSGTQYITAYSEQCDLDSDNLNENFACTGQIADNNWSTKGLAAYR